MTDSGNYADTTNLCYFPGDGWKIKGGAKFCGKPLPCPEHGGRKGFVMDGSLLHAWVQLVEKAENAENARLEEVIKKCQEAILAINAEANYHATRAHDLTTMNVMLLEQLTEAAGEIKQLKDELHRQSMGPRDAIDL